jgi:hypothetical protein
MISRTLWYPSALFLLSHALALSLSSCSEAPGLSRQKMVDEARRRQAKIPEPYYQDTSVNYINRPFAPLSNHQLGICTFNIFQLGHQTTKEHAALAKLLENCDAVVVQEMNAPPWEVELSTGEVLPEDKQSSEFAREMATQGFDGVYLSEEDTGLKKHHGAGTAAEWFIIFYKTDKLELIWDAPSGFLAEARVENQWFDRVPYAFNLRSKRSGKDFVLISVHLAASSETKLNNGEVRSVSESRARRLTEMWAINGWINEAYKMNAERDYIILGDMNIEDGRQLNAVFGSYDEFVDGLNSDKRKIKELFDSYPSDVFLTSHKSLNAPLEGTNVKKVYPFDHIIFDPNHTYEVNSDLEIIDLEEMFGSTRMDSYKFRSRYSDHLPLRFVINDDYDDD